MHAADNVLAAGPTLVGIGADRHPEYQPLAELGHVGDDAGAALLRAAERPAGPVLVWVAMAAGLRIVAGTAALPLCATTVSHLPPYFCAGLGGAVLGAQGGRQET